MNTTPLPAAQKPKSGVNRRFASVRSIFALMLREMATRYGRSPGGYVWALLEPIGGILILAAAFSILIRNPPLGNNFILFYATGFLPFTLYSSVSGAVSTSINFSRPLLQYAAVTWADAAIGRFLLNSLTNVLVSLIMMTAIMMYFDIRLAGDFSAIIIGYALMMLLSAGIGSLNCALQGLFPVWGQLWGVTSRPLMLASGVIILVDDLPAGIRDILWYNPLVHIIAIIRKGFYPTYDPSIASVAYAGGFGLVLLFFGVLLTGRYHREILNM
ncbi:MAG: capsular polysaccharide transport system permease protein [Lentimonas sp.]